MSKVVYIVEMLRYGNREAHSYIMGVYSDRKIAEYEAQIHIIWRAGKYAAEIREEIIDGLGRGFVCYIDEVEMSEDQLIRAIKKRKDKLKKVEELRKKITAETTAGKIEQAAELLNE